MAQFLDFFLTIYKNIASFYIVKTFLCKFFNDIFFTNHFLIARKITKSICKILIYCSKCIM